MGIRERVDTLSRGELAGLVVVIVATLAGVGLWYARSLPRPIDVATTGSAATADPLGVVPLVSGSPVASGAPSAGASASPAVTRLIVDVAGLVRKPGVYEFPLGARVIDAVERAGGARGGADLTLLNLAAPLVDGQQILVPKEGTVVATGGTTGTTGGTTGTTGAIVNVNTADAIALEALNGVGPVLAAAIVAYREENGAFTSVDQLEEVPGIGPSTLEELRDQVAI